MNKFDGWKCPHCKTEYKCGDYPDHWSLDPVRYFLFECESCGARFEIDVEWEPTFTIDHATVRFGKHE
jgi:hypothetical protein